MSAHAGLDSYSPEYLAEDDSQRLIDASIAFIVITTIVLAIFLISRLFCAERNHWEVWVLYPFNYLLCLGLCINGILFVEVGGAGRHMVYWLINDTSVIIPFLKIQTSGEFVYMAGVTFPKVAILILYLRVFVERKVRIVTWIVIGVVLTNWVAIGIIAALVTCQPFAFKWDKTIQGGHCGDLLAAYKYVSVPNILTDLAIAILPLSTLYHLQMSRTRKIGVSLTFMAGSLGIITSVIRFVGFYDSDLESDLWYLGIKTTILTFVEPSAYFICSCLPGMRPLVRAVYKRVSSGHTWDDSATKGLHDFPLGNYKGNNHTSVIATQGQSVPSHDDNKGGFIRLEETVRVDYSPERVA